MTVQPLPRRVQELTAAMLRHDPREANDLPCAVHDLDCNGTHRGRWRMQRIDQVHAARGARSRTSSHDQITEQHDRRQGSGARTKKHGQVFGTGSGLVNQSPGGIV